MIYTFFNALQDSLYSKRCRISLLGLDPEIIEKFKSDAIKLTGEELKEFEDVTFWIHYGFIFVSDLVTLCDIMTMR